MWSYHYGLINKAAARESSHSAISRESRELRNYLKLQPHRITHISFSSTTSCTVILQHATGCDVTYPSSNSIKTQQSARPHHCMKQSIKIPMLFRSLYFLISACSNTKTLRRAATESKPSRKMAAAKSVCCRAQDQLTKECSSYSEHFP